MEQPSISVGTPEEYAYWVSRLRKFLGERGGDADALERLDARINYKGNRITLYRLADPSNERSVADTIAHELLHTLLYQMGEYRAAREIDLVGKPVGSAARVGGI